jgi:MgtC family
LRTNTVVSLDAGIFVVFESRFTATSPARSAARAVTGIGFLGAGVIWKERVNLRDLNTAAALTRRRPASHTGAAPASHLNALDPTAKKNVIERGSSSIAK